MADARIISVLIPAVGGQGGGVLSEWILDAAILAGYPAQSTSIPGVAQRTGSTSYVVEVLSVPRAELDDREPVFCLFPVPGALDILLAPELLEAGRAIEAGFASPACTTIIASTHRLYSIHEKMPPGNATYPTERLLAAARASSRRFVGFDALAVAREHGTEVNAVLLGALAAADVLPMGMEVFRRAIERKGVHVAPNLKGFEAGASVLRAGAPQLDAASNAAGPRVRPEFVAECATLPAELRPTVGEALSRLVDYQDRAYAQRYLERLRALVALDRDPFTLSGIVARHLAVWMTYEDAIRVADLKTRAARLRRIEAEHHAPGRLVITDYLRPDLDELYGILPYRLVRGFAAWAERRWPQGRPTLGQHVRTTTVTGFLRLWLLARLRPLRPGSYRAHHEHTRMVQWLGAVARYASIEYGLACEVARAAQLVKGYGEVRRRMVGAFLALLESVEAVAARDPVAARALASESRTLILRGPEGEAAARDLAARVQEIVQRTGAVLSAAAGRRESA
jgi:indolepyruvate ferredoxin oxidoreductase, beta subunit